MEGGEAWFEYGVLLLNRKTWSTGPVYVAGRRKRTNPIEGPSGCGEGALRWSGPSEAGATDACRDARGNFAI